MTKKNSETIRKLRHKSGRDNEATELFHTDLDNRTRNLCRISFERWYGQNFNTLWQGISVTLTSNMTSSLSSPH